MPLAREDRARARTERQDNRVKALSLVYWASYILPHDNVKAIRIAEAAYEMTLPQPPPPVAHFLTAAAASTFRRHFYTADIRQDYAISCTLLSPDGTKIFTASEISEGYLWNLKGERLAEFDRDEVIHSAVFSPDSSKILICSGEESYELDVWDVKGQCITGFYQHTLVAYSGDFSPDNSKILTISRDHTVQLWNMQGKLLAEFSGHTNSIKTAVFSPDSQKILTASYDGTVKLWYTPPAIYEWLKTADIPRLSRQDKESLGMNTPPRYRPTGSPARSSTSAAATGCKRPGSFWNGGRVE